MAAGAQVMPFHPVKPIRGGFPGDTLFRTLVDNPEWMCQAKINGKRAVWDGRWLWSREGNHIDTGLHMASGLATLGCTVDGEWLNGTYYMFDLPDHTGPLVDRVAALRDIAERTSLFFSIRLCPMDVRWPDVNANGWEGVVFKRLSSQYPKRIRPNCTTAAWVKYRAEWAKEYK